MSELDQLRQARCAAEAAGERLRRLTAAAYTASQTPGSPFTAEQVREAAGVTRQTLLRWAGGAAHPRTGRADEGSREGRGRSG